MIDVVVFTCEKYAHLVPAWLTCWERTFPLPYRLDYVVANKNRIRVPMRYNENATHFSVIADLGFARNLIDYMRGRTEPVMMLMDDHMLFEADVALVAQAWDIIHRTDVGCVRLVPWPGPTQPYDVAGFGEIDKTQEYAISLQASMWKPETLCDLIDPKWNPWQVELEGSKRTAAYPMRFIGCKTCAVNYKDYMLRGGRRPEHADWVDRHL